MRPLSIAGKTLAGFCLAGVVGAASVACGAPGGEPAGGSVPGAASNRGQAYANDPNSRPTALQVARESPDHTTLVEAVLAAELENVLVNPGPITVFAPTNAAFEKLPAGTVDDLLRPENKARLARIITSHASPGTYQGDRLSDGMQLYMATGHYVDVEVRDDGTYVNGTKILGTVDVSNGVVHVVDDVFLIAAE